MKTVNAELIKARIDELQADVERVKAELAELKESAKVQAEADTMQKLDELTRELLTFKAAQAELINLIQV